MLLNDVHPEKRLGFLLGVQVERHAFGGGFRVGIGLAAVGLGLLLWFVARPLWLHP
jgi:hypothetical protein